MYSQSGTRIKAAALLMIAALALPARGTGLEAQSLASRITAVGTGTVRFHFAARAGVCGNGRGNISIRRSSNEWQDECEPGPMRVAVELSARRVTEIRSYVGGAWRGSAELDLGEVSAADATAYLLELAATASGNVAEDAIPPAVFADVPSPWRRLLAIAKDESRPQAARRSATFWVSQAAEEAATRGLAEIVDADGDTELRKHAVFALSQRPRDESVPALIRVARSNPNPELRRSAIFWLGQSHDPRALAYIEDVLLGTP